MKKPKLIHGYTVQRYFVSNENLLVDRQLFDHGEAILIRNAKTKEVIENHPLQPMIKKELLHLSVEAYPRENAEDLLKKVDRYEKTLSEIDSILKEAVASLDQGERVNGLEYARKLIGETLY